MGQITRITRILIADGNFLFRRGLQTLIGQSAALCMVGEAGTGEELLDNVQAVKPDVLIIDGGLLVSQDTTQLRMAMRQAQPSTQILVMAVEESPRTLEAALAVGARGYMLKNSKPAHITAALLSIATHQDGTQSSGMVPDLKALARHTPDAGASQLLTNREREVVRLLAEGKTVRTVASDLSLSAKTVEAHKLNLMRKLDIHDRVSLIAYAAQSGMVAAA